LTANAIDLPYFHLTEGIEMNIFSRAKIVAVLETHNITDRLVCYDFPVYLYTMIANVYVQCYCSPCNLVVVVMMMMTTIIQNKEFIQRSQPRQFSLAVQAMHVFAHVFEPLLR